MEYENCTESSYYFKLLIVGERGVGKTSLIRQYAENIFLEKYERTLGVDFLTKTVILELENNEKTDICLQIWDIAGEARLSSFKKYYYKGADGVLLTFDLAMRESLIKLYTWMEDIRKFCPDAVLYLVGNKSDLKDKVEVQKDERKQYGKILGVVGSIETSARTSKNVDETFQIVYQNVYDKRINT
ncbi:MAG: Rab family GTPase [Candidatus Hodarchaeales archaeon]|jgi:small GTP-binding protein